MLLRRFVFVLLQLFFFGSPSWRFSSYALFSLVLLLAQIHFRPFQDSTENRLETLSLLGLTIMAVLLSAGESPAALPLSAPTLSRTTWPGVAQTRFLSCRARRWCCRSCSWARRACSWPSSWAAVCLRWFAVPSSPSRRPLPRPRSKAQRPAHCLVDPRAQAQALAGPATRITSGSKWSLLASELAECLLGCPVCCWVLVVLSVLCSPLLGFGVRLRLKWF